MINQRRADALFGPGHTKRDEAFAAACATSGGFGCLPAPARASEYAPSAPRAPANPLRKVRALGAASLRDLEISPTQTAAPTFEWVRPEMLLVDESYQRGLSARSIRLVRKIVSGWDWRRYKPPVVSLTPEGLEVIDGQHTAIAAASHPAIAEIPVMVVDAPDRAARAGAFIGQNRDRLGITEMQLHAAALAAGLDEALTLDAVCRRAGVKVLRATPGTGRFWPGETVAVSAIRTLVRRRDPAGAAKVLDVLTRAQRAPISSAQIKAVDLLLFDEAFAGKIDGADITRAFLSLGAKSEREAALFAAAHNVPVWRALAAVLFREGRPTARGRGLRSAPS